MNKRLAGGIFRYAVNQFYKKKKAYVICDWILIELISVKVLNLAK